MKKPPFDLVDQCPMGATATDPIWVFAFCLDIIFLTGNILVRRIYIKTTFIWHYNTKYGK